MANVTLSPRETRIQMIKFTLFSISAGVIQILSFTLMNELAALPSTRTVQAPHSPCAQPFFVPVRPISSRITSSSVRWASTRRARA